MRQPAIVLLAILAALLLPSTAFAAGTLDQSQELVTAGQAVRSDNPEYGLAQTFVAGRTGELTAVAIAPGSPLGKAGSRVEIRAVVGGVPAATVLASAVVRANANYGPGGKVHWIKVAFPQGAFVESGGQYAIVVIGTVSPTLVGLMGGLGDPYPTGQAFWSRNATDWTQAGSLDFSFRTYVL